MTKPTKPMTYVQINTCRNTARALDAWHPYYARNVWRMLDEIDRLREENERARELLKKALEHVLLGRKLEHIKPISGGLLRAEIRTFLDEAQK